MTEDAFLAPSGSFSPSSLEIYVLPPVPKICPIPIRMVLKGRARVMAASMAVFCSLPIKKASIML